jgi:adenylosuccinate lyase
MADGSRGERFEHPLIERYAGKEMVGLFSPRSRYGLWRDLWIALARAQQELGLPVTAAQVEELAVQRDQFDWARLTELEGELRHDVMAHVRHFGEKAPGAKGIIHLGATSCFVTDNADLILYRRALGLVERRLCGVIEALAKLAREHRDLPCLGYTHFQVAQPLTVGKRICMWAQDYVLDLDEVRRVSAWLPFRGVKGATGTQATFLALCEGDHGKVEELDRKVAESMGFTSVIPVSGQTYTRKLDWTIHQAVAGIAQSGGKFGGDLRLLANLGEIEEPIGEQQVGSSAMAYKRNPMRCERVCSLARYVIEAVTATGQTAANQWLERSLDDSAIRRIAIPEAFLAVDGILILVESIARGMEVHREVIERRLRAELPFLATEEILMAGVRAGGDRQELHERIRGHARNAARRVKIEGCENPLLDLLSGDSAFARVQGELSGLLKPDRFIGRSAQQVDAFLEQEVAPRLGGFEGTTSFDEPRV